MRAVTKECTLNLNYKSTALPLDYPLILHCDSTSRYHCYITEFTLFFHFVLVRAESGLCLEEDVILTYMPYEGLNLANQDSRKLGLFSRRSEGNDFLFYCYFDRY